MAKVRLIVELPEWDIQELREAAEDVKDAPNDSEELQWLYLPGLGVEANVIVRSAEILDED